MKLHFIVFARSPGSQSQIPRPLIVDLRPVTTSIDVTVLCCAMVVGRGQAGLGGAGRNGAGRGAFFAFGGRRGLPSYPPGGRGGAHFSLPMGKEKYAPHPPGRGGALG